MTKQKFHKGDRVFIGKMPKWMSHFPANVVGTVEYSYTDAYPWAGTHSPCYRVNIDGQGSVAWYDESQLARLRSEK